MTGRNLYFSVLSVYIVPNFSFSSIFSLGGWGHPEKDLGVWVLKRTKDLGGGELGSGHWGFLL